MKDSQGKVIITLKISQIAKSAEEKGNISKDSYTGTSGQVKIN